MASLLVSSRQPCAEPGVLTDSGGVDDGCRFEQGSRLLALALTVSLALPASAALAAPTVKDSTTSTSRTAELTERDVAASNAKVRMAYSDLASMWSNGFAQMHERFVVPRLLRYRGAARSTCGVMQPNNAAYCPLENAIYYDEVFVAAQAKPPRSTSGPTVTWRASASIAHEMGHAVAMQLGVDAPRPYENEAAADCFGRRLRTARRPQWLAREGRRRRGVLRHGRCRGSDAGADRRSPRRPCDPDDAHPSWATGRRTSGWTISGPGWREEPGRVLRS